MAEVATSQSQHAKEFVELHDQVQTSSKLLDSLESFLSTFQTDLSAVSGQISDLQDRSKDIENRLKTRRRIEKPLSNLISDITIPPSLATLVLDSSVNDEWNTAIEDFERRLETMKVRSRVKAARDINEVAEGLRIVAATKLRGFFLALFQPIRGSVTTNMQVIQTSILLKYKPLFAFLERQALDVAHEVQRSYVASARVYYETGFRRYARSLTVIKARTMEKFETIVADVEWSVDMERLSNAKIDGPSVTLAYMADDKAYKEPIEALLRSLLLVFMDNSTAEYAFIKNFFVVEASLPQDELSNSILSPKSMLSPTESQSISGSDYGGLQSRSNSISFRSISASLSNLGKEAQNSVDIIWKQVFDPVLAYTQNFLTAAIDPTPPTIVLLTMVRITEDIAAEIENRGAPPVSSFAFALRLQLWPIFQRTMTDHIDALKKLAEGGGGGYFSRPPPISESTVMTVSHRYGVMFNSFVMLTEQEAETMIFSNLLRLRQELVKMIDRHANQTNDSIGKASALSRIYEKLLQDLTTNTVSGAHPKAQQELAYWSNLKESSLRKIVSVNQAQARG